MILPRRLRAPQQDRGVLAEPPLADVAAVLGRNRRLLRKQTGTLLGESWTELRSRARQTALEVAQAYFRQAGEPAVPENGDSVVMAGHQPELFHPGVWVKNFALHAIARRHGATPVNLIVDTDTAKAAGLRVPASSCPLDSEAFRAHPVVRLAVVPFDHGPTEEPYEERAVHDEALFAGFPERVAEMTPGWGFQPLLPAFWEEVWTQARRPCLLGERLAAARRALERRWGCHNLELPVSLLCRTEPFAWFACHLLANLPSFHATYNACVQDYRRLYGLRSRHHPVPDLAAEGDWREVPFWTWRAGQKRRGRLFARLTATAIRLRAGTETWPDLPLPQDAKGAAAVAAWLELERQGFKVRSRALTNTLYARLFLADLFVHGIGGGKYDEVTDEIIRRFYHREAPGFLVLSATLRLPLPTFPVEPEDCRRLARELRDLRQNPQRHLGSLAPSDGTAAIGELATQKQEWIARPVQTHRQRRERFQALRALTEKLRPFIAGAEQELRPHWVRCEEQVQANMVLRRRDYAFCLFPESLLRPFCTQFLP